MGSRNGDGMDGGILRNKFWGGGRFSFALKSGNNECETGYLNTEDNNWQKGEVNYFVGHQIRGCENFDLNVPSLQLEVKHSGNDGGRIEFADFWTSERNFGLQFHCNIGQKR